MNVSDLPVGNHPPALDLPHFPTRFQAVIWRNWQLVGPERLAHILGTDVPHVLAAAQALGLPVPPNVEPRWLTRGYVTLIRNNWHLLPYEQLLLLLDWTPDQLAFALREDDFLWQKLGNLKPRCEPVTYHDLSPEETHRTAELRVIMDRYFEPSRRTYTEPPFSFIDRYRSATGRTHTPPAKSPFELRFIYPYFAVYGDALINPDLDPFPDGLLESLAGYGINGVWMQAILYTLYPWPLAPELAEGWEKRLATLRALCDRAARYGVGIYLYLNEPRSMPIGFFDRYPDLKGVVEGNGREALAALCTSTPAVKDFLRQGVRHVFDRVPQLAGTFTITASENLTHCWSHFKGASCPRCARRRPAEVIAEVNALIAEGAHAAKPEANVIAWTWGWGINSDTDWTTEAIDRLPKDVMLMCTSEEYVPITTGGVNTRVTDYSISNPGPGDRAKSLWARAKARGLKTIAKVQLNTTWECSALPYIPAVDLVEGHLDRLRAAGVDGIMASWTLGGFPGGNLELLTHSATELADRDFGPAAAPDIRRAWTAFSDAFREFPFSCPVAYLGPHNPGPRNLFHAASSGYRAAMVGFPYDDLNAWRSEYPAEVFEEQFRKLSDGWKTGIEWLDRAKPLVPSDKRANWDQLHRVALANWCHYRSAYLQIAFTRARDAGTLTVEQVNRIMDEEIQICRTLADLARSDSRIGYESSNHYTYSINDLIEKVLNCESVRRAITGEKT